MLISSSLTTTHLTVQHKSLRAEADKNERVHLLLRTDRRGLGTATLEGIQWAQKRAAEVVVHLDGDFSHNPADIPRLIAALKLSDDVAN